VRAVATEVGTVSYTTSNAGADCADERVKFAAELTRYTNVRHRTDVARERMHK